MFRPAAGRSIKSVLASLLGLLAASAAGAPDPAPAAAAAAPVAAAAATVPASQDPGGWPTYGGQPSGTQYSPLDQVTPANIHRLEVAWTYHVGEISDGDEKADAVSCQVTPIYANDRLYLCTPFNHVAALDPASGAELWRFDPQKPLTGAFYGANYCRGVAYWEAAGRDEARAFCGRRVIEVTQDGVLLALDADSGRPCADFGDQGRVDLNQLDYRGNGRLYSTSPAAVYRDVLIVGGSLYDNKWRDALDGIVRGFDARSGAELWSWNPIPAHLGSVTGGANAWPPIAIDQERGWAFLATGSPSYDAYGVSRKDPIPYANAVVALDALAGKAVWSYQAVRHDLWDYDLPAMPTLAAVVRDGKKIPAVLQATKTGFIFVLDRRDGRPLFPVEERPAPRTDMPGEYAAPTQPAPLLPPPITSQSLAAEDAWGFALLDKMECRRMLAALRNDGLYTPPSLRGSVLHPSFLGGTNWGGLAYDEASGLAVLNSSNLVASVQLVPRDEYDPDKHGKPPDVSYYEMRGSPYIMLRKTLFSSLGAPCNPPPWGSLSAVDMNRGEIRWQAPFGQVQLAGPIKSPAAWGAPNQGGPIITGGGLVFIGAGPDNLLRAYDLHTGKRLRQGKLPAPGAATPMTYRHGASPRQYIVIAAGGHGAFKTAKSDAVVAFALRP